MPQYSSRNSRWVIGALSGALLLGGAACDDNNFNAVVILAAGIAVTTGSDGQIGTVNQPLPNPIVVHVTDRNGNSSANTIVAWTVISGGGSVSARCDDDRRERQYVRDLDDGTDGWCGFASCIARVGRLGDHHRDRAGRCHYVDDYEDEWRRADDRPRTQRALRWWCSFRISLAIRWPAPR